MAATAPHGRQEATLSAEFSAWPVVCVAAARWGSWMGPVSHVVAELARRHEVIFIEMLPAGHRFQRGLDMRRGERLDGVAVYTHISPLPHLRSLLPSVVVEALYGVTSRVNGLSLRRFVAAVAARHGLERAVLWCWEPLSRATLSACPWALRVYHCYDDLPSFPSNRKLGKALAAEERRLTAEADLVFATSRSLYESRRRFNPNTYYVPNGADVELFGRAADGATPVAPEMAGLPRPIIGYVGGVDFRLDFGLVRRLAAAYPSASLVLVGEVRAYGDPVFELAKLPNVHYLGKKPYGELPAYLKAMDVCLIPWVVSPATEAMYPIKLHEYLAAGKPVVSTPLPEVVAFGSVACVAEPDAFVDAVGRALRDDSIDAVARRKGVAAVNSWGERVRRMETLVDEHLARGRR